MKIAIIGFTKLKYMPYLDFYLSEISHAKNEIHILYWNRDIKEENLEKYSCYKLHEFKFFQEDEVPKINKIKSFCLFSRYAKRFLSELKPDFIIVLHTLPAILIYGMLVRKFSQKYILDYRDSTYERLYVFRMIVGNLVNHSLLTFVSSDAFRVFLPTGAKDKILTSHNIVSDSLEHIGKVSSRKQSVIHISFWGFIRDVEINLCLIKALANDIRFELHYYGREQKTAKDLITYVEKKGIKNVFFHGEYLPEERYQFAKETDVIHNLYRESNTMLAMGNKFYDGLIFRIPQICIKDSFMGKRNSQFGTGIECDPKDEFFADTIYNYYMSIDFADFNLKCEKALSSVLAEYYRGKEILHGVFNCDD